MLYPAKPVGNQGFKFSKLHWSLKMKMQDAQMEMARVLQNIIF